MKRLFLFQLILIAALLISCSKDNEVTSPNDVFITGNWKIEFSVTTSSRTDVVKLSAVLNGKDNTITGTGDVTYSGSVGTSKFSYYIVDNATGAYSGDGNGISLIITSTITGNQFKFAGNRDNSASVPTYKGSINITVNGVTTPFTNITLFKSAS